jgi:hypothetical protein
MQKNEPAAPDHVVLSIELIEAPGRGYRWRLRTADDDIVNESGILASMQQCIEDVCSLPLFQKDKLH